MTETSNAAADRVVDFLNSRGVGFEQGVDMLTDAASARQLFATLGFKAGKEATARQLDELRRLRSVLQDLMGKDKPAAKTLAALDQLAAIHHFRYRYTPDLQVVLEAVEPSVATQMIEDVAGLISGGNWDRVKSCANPDCGAVFYDPTRARTRRWHAFETCGNKNNVAKFRQRAASGE
jgi:predicted RNA-binding Zn ribbon-like protein